MTHANVKREAAIAALKKHEGDVVGAIMVSFLFFQRRGGGEEERRRGGEEEQQEERKRRREGRGRERKIERESLVLTLRNRN